MRSNPWQITAIIAVVLVVLLIIPLVIMGRDRQTLAEQTAQAKKEQSEADTKARALANELVTLKTLIGSPDAETTKIQEEHASTLGVVLPGEGGQTYHNALTALLGDLDRERKALNETTEKYEKTQTDLATERDRNKVGVDQLTTRLNKTNADLSALQGQFQRTKAEYDAKFQEAHKQHEATIFKADHEKNEYQRQVLQLTNDNQDISEQNRTLTGMLAGIRDPNIEYPAGKIVSVDQQAGSAIINVGKDDGLLVRTMFSVYNASVTGLSFRTVPTGRDPVYCDVCQREVGRDASKASIEVMQILGPHLAEVRILDDILTDPIMAGDVIYSPIWKPGQRMHFALTAGMRLPGSSSESGTAAVKQLIESNGGIVDCWIDETAEGDEDYIKGAISDTTNFIIVNEQFARQLDSRVAGVQQELVESAKLRNIKVISLEDMLLRMSWKNMTPVHRFDDPAFTSETRAVPQHQGSIRQSSGVVAPIFTPDNTRSRVNSRDANPVRPSTTPVSPLFNDKAPPPTSSGGNTSELFRPRSPQ